jgi:hypothetical protein
MHYSTFAAALCALSVGLQAAPTPTSQGIQVSDDRVGMDKLVRYVLFTSVFNSCVTTSMSRSAYAVDYPQSPLCRR